MTYRDEAHIKRSGVARSDTPIATQWRIGATPTLGEAAGRAPRKPTERQTAWRAGAEGTEALAEPGGRRPTPQAEDAHK